MRLGIVGLPNVGKSTLFNCLTLNEVEAANYPFCTIEPNVGIVPVPDYRLDVLAKLYETERVTPAVIEFVDIAGLVKGASKGEGLGNKFLSHIREVDAILHVVRCFDDSNVVHVDGDVDPIRDIEIINLELIFADLEVLERRISRAAKASKQDKSIQKELEILHLIYESLEKGQPARWLTFDDEHTLSFVKSLNLLSFKPVLFAANVSEDDLKNDAKNNPYVSSVREYVKSDHSEVFVISAKVEADICQLDPEDKNLFLDDLGISESGLDKLIAASYKLLGLISFLTAGKKECRAWTIPHGTKAPQAAGKIHTDFERGFIKAEVVSYDDLTRLNSYSLAKEHGLVRLEGKDYIVKDGDVILFRFNV